MYYYNNTSTRTHSSNELCRIRCLFTMNYVAMTFRQISFVAVNYEQDEFCRRSIDIILLLHLQKELSLFV